MVAVNLQGIEALDERTQFALNRAIIATQDLLTAFAASEDWLSVITTAFGDRFEPRKLEQLRQQWRDQNFNSLPEIEVRSAAELKGANGAFAAATNKVYLSREYVVGNVRNPGAIMDVLLEEFGHYIDSQLKPIDSSGDEGAIFSELVLGEELSEVRLQRLKAEDDRVAVSLDGQSIQIEQQTNFNIEFDYTFDDRNFFAPQERKDALEAAASFWEDVINDEFNNIPGTGNLPAGVNKLKLKFKNPSNPSQTIEQDVGSEIDDLRIYVGSVESLTKVVEVEVEVEVEVKTKIITLLAEGSYGGFDIDDINSRLGRRLKNRLEGKDFEPFVGILRFNVDDIGGVIPRNPSPYLGKKWYFDPTPRNIKDDLKTLRNSVDVLGAKDAFDFVSVAIHEIGHVLGINLGANAFQQLIAPRGVEKFFTGPNAKQVNNGQEVPLITETGAHVKSLTSVMNPGVNPGTRVVPQALDLAILKDIGYDTDPSRLQSAFNWGKVRDGIFTALSPSTEQVVENIFSEEVSEQIIPLLNEEDVQLSSFTNSSTGASSLASETLSTSNSAIEAADQELPEAINFIGEIRNTLFSVFDQLANLGNQGDLELAEQLLFDVLGPDGLKLVENEEDVNISGSPGEDLLFNLTLSSNQSFFERSLDANFGLPWLGLNTKTDGQVKTGFQYEFNFSFGLQDGEFFFNTPSEEDLKIFIDASIPDAELEGSLGFLQVDVRDEDADENPDNDGSDIDGNGVSPSKVSFGVDVNFDSLDLSDGIEGSELDSLQITPEGAAAIGLDIETRLADFDNELLASLPKISTGLNLNWDFVEGGSAPEVQFNDVSLDLGSFFNGFAGPVLKSVQKVTEPFRPLIDKITSELPVINISLLDLAQKVPSGIIDEGTSEFIDQVKEIIEIVETTNAIDVDNLDIKIDLGSFNLGDTDVRNLSNLSNTDLNRTRNPEELDEQISENVMVMEEVAPFFQELDDFKGDSDNGLSFPFLENDLSQAVDLVSLFLGNRGEDVEFFTYQTPKLGFNFDLSNILPPVPVFGPIVLQFGGGAGAGAQIQFGFDTEGLVDFANNGFDDPKLISNGFFVSRPDNENKLNEANNNLFLEGLLTAEAAANVAVASLGAGGGIGLEVGLGVAEELNGEATGGKIRASDIANEPPLCLFDFGGSLSAIIFASLKLGFGFFSFTKRFNLADVNIIDFTFDTCKQPLEAYFDVKDPDKISPKIENMLAEQGIIDRKGTDAGNIIRVLTRNDDFPQNLTLVGLDEDPGKDYDDVKLIVLDGERGNDRIEFEPGVRVSGQLEGKEGDDTLIGGLGFDFLTGGAGNDVLDGGGGDEPNTAVYADAPAPGTTGQAAVTVDLNEGTAQDGFGTTDELINIENVEGSPYKDILIGNANTNVLDGGAGDDELRGNAGDDVILAGVGADTIDGGSGQDTTTYFGSKSSVYVNLSSQEIPANSSTLFLSPENQVPLSLPANRGFGGEAQGDEIANVENVQGSIYDDILVASDSDSGHIDGFDGNDIIFAGP